MKPMITVTTAVHSPRRGCWLAVLAVATVAAMVSTGSLGQETAPAAGSKAPAADAGPAADNLAAKPPAKPPAATPLYDQEPFDVVTLDEASKNARLKVFPLLFPNRRVPNAAPDSKLVVRLLENEDEEYEIAWRNIRKVELFEELLLNEGNRLVQESQGKTVEEKARLLDEAFLHFYRVQQADPNWPGLKESVNRYLYYDAGNLAVQQKYDEAFAILEQLYDRSPTFRLSETSRPVGDVLSVLLDRILARYYEQQNFLGMRTLLKRVAVRYGAKRPPSVDNWALRLKQLAAQKRDEGRQHLDAQRYRQAIVSVKEMRGIWPDVDGGPQLEVAIATAYPIAFVGVTQPALEHDAERLDNWPARRTGRLVRRTLVEFLGAGPEGGQYQLSLGSIDHSEDRLQLLLRLSQAAAAGKTAVTGYEVSRRLLDIASPDSPDYIPAWAALVSSVAVKNVFTVEVNLRRPHVLPEAFLRVPLVAAPPNAPPNAPPTVPSTGAENQPPHPADPRFDGPFRIQARTDTETQFANKTFSPNAALAEIVEVTYNDSQRGLAALRRGEIDVLDRLFPGDALRVRAEASNDAAITIEPYSLPTVHMLVAKSKSPFLANRDFRRALLLAINRENILRQELMGGRDFPGFQVVSGPFPARAGEADPLGYAYDESTQPIPFSPLLAKALVIVSSKQVVDLAAKRGDPVPKLDKLVIGFPGHEIARVACQAISAQLQVIGLPVELREFPPGVSTDAQGDCDLVYEEIAVWEPVTDAQRLLGARGVAPTQSPYVQQSLRWLNEAENWGEARERLIDIHRAVHNDVAVLPLWQTVDFFAYNQRLKNLGSNPVWLYQNVEQWRLSVGAE